MTLAFDAEATAVAAHTRGIILSREVGKEPAMAVRLPSDSNVKVEVVQRNQRRLVVPTNVKPGAPARP